MYLTQLICIYSIGSEFLNGFFLKTYVCTCQNILWNENIFTIGNASVYAPIKYCAAYSIIFSNLEFYLLAELV